MGGNPLAENCLYINMFLYNPHIMAPLDILYFDDCRHIIEGIVRKLLFEVLSGYTFLRQK